MQAGFTLQCCPWCYFVCTQVKTILDQQVQILIAEVGALRQHCQLQISLLLHTVATMALLSCSTVNCNVNTSLRGYYLIL